MSIDQEEGSVQLGSEKKKIIPTALGTSINDFLIKNFPELMDYKFTAKMEEELDKVANGKKVWHEVIREFYDKFSPLISELAHAKGISAENEKYLGKDAEGNDIYTTITRLPVVKKKVGEKFFFANIVEPLTIDTIKLKDIRKLFEWPKKLGTHEKKDVMLQKGQHGFYLKYNDENVSIPDTIVNKESITLPEAIELIKGQKSRTIKEMMITEGDNKKKTKVSILNGQFGPFIQIVRGVKKVNFQIPKTIDPKNLTEELVKEIISRKKTNKFEKKTDRQDEKKAEPAKGGKAVTKAPIKAPVKKPVAKPKIGSKTAKK